MRYGVFSDAHANLEALRAVLAKLEHEKVQGYIFCGDMIGYGPQPDECVGVIKKLPNLAAVMGNHDSALNDTSLLNFFSPDSLPPLRVANEELSKENFRFVSSLPQTYTGGHFHVVHGSFLDPIKEYWITKQQYKANYDLWKGDVCFVGHTHIPFIMHSKDNQEIRIDLFTREEAEIQLDKNARYVINPGSVGQPRDGDNRAAAGVYDSEKNTFKIIRAEYDIERTQYLMASKGFSNRIIERLSTGM
ncbi:MAG: metallophosphatase family protein [Elusimicrobium sp.]|jgi:predicted phosphodiesterase|nr:metallophosphatase family protein [Elusimicrobium sp.]